MIRFDYDVQTMVDFKNDEKLDMAKGLQKDTGISSEDAKQAMGEEEGKRNGILGEKGRLYKKWAVTFLWFLVAVVFTYAWWKYK